LRLAFAASFTSSGLFMLQGFANFDKTLSAVVIVAYALPPFLASKGSLLYYPFG
jgi:hypothetical protein